MTAVLNLPTWEAEGIGGLIVAIIWLIVDYIRSRRGSSPPPVRRGPTP